ncbi:MAG: nucleotide exchange factor GrpE [bacterium]|nr:nucleotide exchange factor GrpE [bacterium]
MISEPKKEMHGNDSHGDAKKEGKETLSPPTEDPKKLLEECQKQKDEYLAGWQRARADFLNYKKDEMERIQTLIEYANEEMILKILPLLDNMELAEKHLSDDLKNNEYVKGLLQIKAQFSDFLKNQGVESIEAIGKKFDPALHEVVEEVEAKGKELGTVAEEVQKGYLMRQKLLRPTKIKITK